MRVSIEFFKGLPTAFRASNPHPDAARMRPHPVRSYRLSGFGEWHRAQGQLVATTRFRVFSHVKSCETSKRSTIALHVFS